MNVKTKEIGIKVTDETVSDGSSFISLVDQSADNLPGRKIEKAIVDGAFDRREIFDYLQHKHIQPVIKTGSNASTKARGSPSRAKNRRISATNLGTKIWLWQEMSRRNRILFSETNFRRACLGNQDRKYVS